jgi:hypothetical protein
MKLFAIASMLTVTSLVTATSPFAGAARESGAAESRGQALSTPNPVAPYFYPRRLYAFRLNGHVRRHREGWSH